MQGYTRGDPIVWGFWGNKMQFGSAERKKEGIGSYLTEKEGNCAFLTYTFDNE